MTKWEYNVVDTRAGVLKKMDGEEILNYFGKDGWEAFQIEFRTGVPFGGYLIIYFKRQVIRDDSV